MRAVALALIGLAATPDPSTVGEAVAIDSDGVLCEVRSSKANYRAGDSPAVWVKIFNTSRVGIFLPGSLDDSERRKRYPYAYLEIDGPEGGIERRGALGCAHINPVREADLVRLEPGQFFDPFENLGPGGFFPPSEFEGARLVKPGRYEIVFHYSTAEPDLERWKGTTDALSPEIVEMLRHVPRVTTSCSTTIVVRP